MLSKLLSPQRPLRIFYWP